MTINEHTKLDTPEVVLAYTFPELKPPESKQPLPCSEPPGPRAGIVAGHGQAGHLPERGVKDEFDPKDWYDWVFILNRSTVDRINGMTLTGKIFLAPFTIATAAIFTIIWWCFFCVLVPIGLCAEAWERMGKSPGYIRFKKWIESFFFREE